MFYNFQVATLFDDHVDLLDEFTRFLPEAAAVSAAHNASYLRNSFQRFNERNSATPALRQMHVEKVVFYASLVRFILLLYLMDYNGEQIIYFFQQRIRRDRILTSHADRDLSVDHPELDDDKAMVKMHKEQRKRVEKDSRDRKSRDQDDREPDHDNNRDFNLQRVPDKRKSARKVEGFGVSANFASYDDKDTLKSESTMLFD